MHEVLVNRLGGLSLPRKSVGRLTDRPDMTLDVYRGRKTTKQQNSLQIFLHFAKIIKFILMKTREANILNQFFTEQTILDEMTVMPASLPRVHQESPHKLESISTSSLEDILKTLKTGKAAGLDSIDDRLLKELARPLSAPLTDLFNFSLLKVKFQISGNRPMSLLCLKRMTRQMYLTIDLYPYLILLVKVLKKCT